MSETKIQIKHVPLSEINPADYNPREISENAFKGLLKSLEKFGLIDPLIINKTTGTLVGGHQRLRAAKTLGLETVPVIEVELSEREERALNVSLNNPNISGFFTDQLSGILDELKFNFGEEYLKELNLDELIPPESWDDDVSEIDGNLDGIECTIKITCDTEDRSKLVDFLRNTIEGSDFVGVTVD